MQWVVNNSPDKVIEGFKFFFKRSIDNFFFNIFGDEDKNIKSH